VHHRDSSARLILEELTASREQNLPKRKTNLAKHSKGKDGKSREQSRIRANPQTDIIQHNACTFSGSQPLQLAKHRSRRTTIPESSPQKEEVEDRRPQRRLEGSNMDSISRLSPSPPSHRHSFLRACSVSRQTLGIEAVRFQRK
jgi:hypothetical protein